jgi:hypothetical protein
MKPQSNIKIILFCFSQWLGAFVAFLFSLTISNMILPMAPNIMAAVPSKGFLSTSMAFLLNGVVNAFLFVWAMRRSSFRGLLMVAQLATLSFGAQVFMTQIETAYFISAFPLLYGNFELYKIVLRGLLTSVIFTFFVTLIGGGFSKKARPKAFFSIQSNLAVRAGAWLALVYVVLYFLFGYFVAWQSQDVRLFYGGPAELNSFFNQIRQFLMDRPEVPVFQYFRAVLWMLCLVPLFQGFSGKRIELTILSGLSLALLPTVQLSFPNPLMPVGVSQAHFWEVSISTGIFGALCAWAVPKEALTV